MEIINIIYLNLLHQLIFYPLLNILSYTFNTVLTCSHGLMHTGTDLPQPTTKTH